MFVHHDPTMNCASVNDSHGDALAHLFDVVTAVHISNSPCTWTPEHSSKTAITMVYADSVNNSIIVCIGLSLQICKPPDAPAQLLAGNPNENGFKDGHCGEARLSTVHGVAVDRNRVVIFTDWMNHCIREIATDGHVRTLYGPTPSSADSRNIAGENGFLDGCANEARFHRPWGLCLCNEDSSVIVVDSCNSSLRCIDRTSGNVTTMCIAQDMSPAIDTGITPNPTQMYYPTTVCKSHGRSVHTEHTPYVYVVNGSSSEVFRVNIATNTFRSMQCVQHPPIQYRPATLAVTKSDRLVVGYTGYQFGTPCNNIKYVQFGDVELFLAHRDPILYLNRQKVEFCACICLAMAENLNTRAVTLWITDARAESRLLRVCLRLKWEFMRLLLLAVRKPTHHALLALLPTYTHGSSTQCPILDHIVVLLEGVVAFA